MSWYPVLKHLHVTAVGLSGFLFLLRGLWMLADSPRLQQRWVKILPHAVDTVLLVAGLALALAVYHYPQVHMPWLTTKLVALVVYIGLGTVALKRGRTKAVRATAWVLALAVFGYIVAVALTKTPWPL